MVRSKLNTDIVYQDKTSIDKSDEDKDAVVYEVIIKGLLVKIAIGEEKYTYIDNNIVYFPVYLVKDDFVVSQIGLYEALYSNLPNLIDDEGDIDISKLYEPIIYPSVTTEILKDAEIQNTEVLQSNKEPVDSIKNNEDEDNEDDDEDEDDEEDDEEYDAVVDELENEAEEVLNPEDVIFSSIEALAKPSLPEETAEDSNAIEENFKDSKSKPWIQRFMKNSYYNIIKSTGNSDCLFEVIKQAYMQLGKTTNVSILRRKLAEATTSDVYNAYKNIYNTYHSSLEDDTAALKQLVRKHKDLKQKLNSVKALTSQMDVIKSAKDIEKQHKEVKMEMLVSKTFLEKYDFMDKIKSLEDFKSLIQTCGFWADTWAMSVLEELLNLKIIVLSSSAFLKEDYHNVLVCNFGDRLNLKLERKFNPSHYIIVSKDGDNYDLITYKERGIFTFQELPYTLREMVITKCMEETSSPYNMIPEFIDMQKTLGLYDGGRAAVDFDKQNIMDTDCESNVIFILYDKSQSDALPGLAPGEEIPVELIHDYAKLLQDPNWRQVLSRDYMSPIVAKGKTWPSITHYYEGSKFKKEHPEFADLFTKESKSDISKDPYMATAIGSGMKTYKGRDINIDNIKLDKDAITNNGRGRHLDELRFAISSRLKQDPKFRETLKNTKQAKLFSFRHGKPPRLERELITARNFKE